ncbi:MAG TPA: hypothetical protein VHE53_02335 [Patescibacteria group bacterium]|nr:hypothetical protein [Patescibacteria group bacterium]
MRIRDSRGQMLLVVVLTMIVALTVGLSVVSRTVTNLRISRQNEESQRAFEAAEAGVEQVLQSQTTNSNLQLSNNAKYDTTSSDLQGSGFLLNGADTVDQDSGMDIWLANYPDYASPLTGNVTIYWSTSNQSCSETNGANVVPALEVVVLSGSVVNPTFNKYVYDPCGRIQNALANGSGGTIDGEAFKYAATIPVSTGLIAKAIPIYNSTKMGITSTGALPNQGKLIESTGQSGDTVRKITYFESHPQVPLEIFPYSIISQ